ncbi:MAG TPA: nitronate monooxygenase [Caulobacteraceae bacterium]|nr:nitronate monooxygenase [Caulobacteraceae bacterium]
MTARDFFDRLPIPIVQAPMVGASSFEMSLAVSRAGGLGTLAGGAMPPGEIEAEAARFRAAGDAPFAINLLMADHRARPDAATLQAALDRLGPWYTAVGLPPPAAPNDYAPDFDAQFAALVRAAPTVASFAFDRLSAERVGALKAAGSLVVGTATTVAEARAWAEVGADAISAQGFEAGGHRGHFLAELEASLVGTLPLVAAVRAATGLPVLAAGGIMDGRGVAAVLALGAAAAQMGTAFLLADEASSSAPWRAAAAAAPDDATRLTRAFTGRYARGIENRFMREMRTQEADVPDYPVQNRLTKPMRAAAARAGEADMISLWAGQGVTLARPGRSDELVRRWWDEARDAARALAARTAT